MSTGSEIFSLFICHDANKFVLLSFFTLTEASCAKSGQNHCPIMQKVHSGRRAACSKTVLLKLRLSTTGFSENVVVANTAFCDLERA